MTTIVFSTPGTLDVRAFTTMGVSAKPRTDHPIGYFGTGLKYAMAVLARMGAQVVVHTGGVRYWFETQPLRFREQDFQQIVMRRDTWTGAQGWRLGRRQKLPFTTQYGRNWEAWMAFRELYANTLDEGGNTWEDTAWPEMFLEEGDRTLIAVGGCEDFTKAYHDRSSIFVDLAEKTKLAALPGLEILEGETQRMFYQGMRAKDLGKPTLHTYNFTHGQDLTEDRQLAHEWRLRTTLANIVASNCEDEALIEKIITADDKHWEHGVQPDSWVRPSAAFHAVMMRKPRGVGGGWYSYYGTHDARPEAREADLWKDSPRPWRVDEGDVLAADGMVLFSKPFNLNEHKWARLAGKLVELANQSDAQYFTRTPAARPALWEDLASYEYDEQDCPGHVARWDNGKVCGLCGVHVDSLRPDDDGVDF